MMNRFLALVVVLMSAVPAAAQQGGPALNPKALSTVTVFDDRGVRTPGRLLRIDAESVLVLVDGQERRFELDHVAKVEKRGDSLKNGLIIGAIAGAVMGAVVGGLQPCSKPDEPYAECGAGTYVAAAATLSATFAGIGAGIDAMIPGHTTLYKRPSTSAPVSHGAGASLRFSVSW
jgi:hypothetical protein